MRSFPRASTLVPVCVALAAASLLVRPATLQADDLGRSLRSAFEDTPVASAKDDADAAKDEPAKPKTEATDDKSKQPKAAEAKPEKEKADDSKAAASDEEPAKPKAKPKYPPFAEVTKDTQKIEGLITLYRKDDTLLAELGPEDMNHDLIVLISIARGIGQTPILGGYSWNFGDDWVWQFRKAGEQIHLVRRNVRFTADKGSPTARAVTVAYTDSVLFSLPIITKSPDGGYVVDLTPVFMSDLPQISMVLPGFSFSQSKSSWAEVNGYAKNVELQVAATYASSGMSDIDSVPDSRGVTINIHYSISELPQTSYKPRLADDRVGYFLAVRKDYSKKDVEDRFVRYITRWNLEKADPEAEVSPPKEAIIFWLDKTIPFKYRKPIRDGILEWNKAFEKAGYYDAIEVRQQPDDATWDPGDIRYNTFQWITASAGFAQGPSRVNPSTGQILDADIIFDADFLQYWKQEYEMFTPENVAAMTGGAVDLEEYRAGLKKMPAYMQESRGLRSNCILLGGMSHQLALGASVMSARKYSDADLDKLVTQGLKEVTMHEVGHTLGLSHNFRASSYYSLADLNDVSKTKDTGLGMSVMDYNPVNIVPTDAAQGDYFSQTIGPYDMWAIEYGYKPLKASSPDAELPELKKIADKSGDPRYALATDDDVRGIDPDPRSERFDLGNDPVAYAKSEAKVVAESWPKIVDGLTDKGDGYQKARRAFNVLLTRQGQAMFLASEVVGGMYVNRSHKGDDNAQPPLDPIPVDKQREALGMLEEQMFSDTPFNFPPELYSHLAASHWDHWGVTPVERVDFPAHEVILMWQDRILSKLLSSLTLARIHDTELKIPGDKEALTDAELIQRLTKSIFAETDSVKSGDFTDRKPAISSLRRDLQRSYLRRLSRLALGQTAAPEDCQTIAFADLTSLKKRIDSLLDRDVKFDSYSRAHLEESSARIAKVVDAKMSVSP
jgi:Met-zincin/Domain of unknown function (DUF5117)